MQSSSDSYLGETMLHEHLVEQWDLAWDGDGWHASWTKALGDLSALQAAWVPDGARHSIWQLVNHVVFWRNVTLNKAEGLPTPSEAECNQRNFEAPADVSEDAWSNTKQALEDSYRALRPILEGKKPGLDRAKYHLTHDAYHLGQIMHLRAMQGMKPIV